MGRSYKAKVNVKAFNDPSNVPSVMLEETMERRPIKVQMDDADLNLKLTAGHDLKVRL